MNTVSTRWGRFGLGLALLALASCGGGGDESTPGSSKLFIADGGNHQLVSIINAAPTVGSTFNIDRLVTGVAAVTAGVSAIPSMALHAAADRLYVATQGNTFIYDGISQANGAAAPTRTMGATINTGTGNRAVNFFRISLDAANSVLYTVDFFGEVHVFNNPTTPAGATTVTRIITPDVAPSTIAFTSGLAIDTANNMLYLGADFGGASHIIVFNNASTAGTAPTTTTPLAPNRTLNFAASIGSFHLDTLNNRLYVSQPNGIVLVFDNASALASGTPTANRIIDLGVAQRFRIPYSIFVETGRNKLYAVGNEAGGSTSIVWIIDNASTANDSGGAVSDGVAVEPTNMALSAVAVAP